MATAARRAIILATTAIIGVAVALAAVLIVPRHYIATADVLLGAHKAVGAAATQALDPALVPSLAAVAGAAAADRKVAISLNLPQTDLLSAEQVDDTQVVRITGTSDSPETAANVARGGVAEFLSWLQTDGRVTGSVISDAVASGDEPYPARWLWPPTGALVGLLLGLPLALRRGRSQRSPVTTAAELADAAQAPALGVVGRSPDIAGNPLISSLDPSHPASEAIRIVRTNLTYLEGSTRHRVIVITSANPAEGKSTTACNLGISLAQTGASVILVEGDLRRPQLAQYLGIRSGAGLVTVLTGQAHLADAIEQSRIAGLDVLTSGAIPPNPAEILQTDAMRNLLMQLRAAYDYVLIDAPPVLPVADAPLLAASADAVVLAARYGSTGIDQVKAAAGRITAVGGRVVGTVLTMSPRRETERYGNGYGYGAIEGQRATRARTSSANRGGRRRAR